MPHPKYLKPINHFILKRVEEIESTGKLRTEIAREIGFKRSQYFSMILTGDKVPNNRIPAIARVLGVDPRHLFRLKMQEEWDDPVLIETLLAYVVTQNEREILEHVRTVSGETDPALNDRLRNAIAGAFDDGGAET